MSGPILQMRGIQKRFGGVKALRGVDFDLNVGEVHALLGENGAGKSTLMGILSGVHAPDEGEMLIDGAPVHFKSPRDAQANGIATVFQELDLVPGLDIAANLFLGRELVKPTGVLDFAGMREEARKRLGIYNLDLDPGRAVGELSIGQRQLVAIVKALFYASRVLVLDEPTAALTASEAAQLFVTVRDLRQRGVSIIYISHRLEEIPQVADRVTVLRDGLVAGVTRPDAPQRELVQLLVGRPFDELFPKRGQTAGRELLKLENARFDLKTAYPGWQAAEDVTLTVRAREIVGLAGIMGAGRTELLSALYGTGPQGQWHGTVEVDGKAPNLSSVRAAKRAGIAMVSDDRRGSGLMLAMPVRRNLVMSILKRVSRFGLMSRVLELAAVTRAVAQFDIRPRNPDLVVGNLSGGNQQKVVLAKEILSEPSLLLLDEPTRGVDVGAKGEIYARLRALANEGLAILVASSELPELVGLCDRVVVLRNGRTVAEYSGQIDELSVLISATQTESPTYA